MARKNPRLAVGVGVLAAFLLVGGSGATVAIADPGDHGGRHNNSEGGEQGRNGSKGDDKNHTGSKDDDLNDGGDNNGSRYDAADEGDAANSHAPLAKVGSGRDDQAWLAPGGARVSGSTSEIEAAAVEPGATGGTTAGGASDDGATGGTTGQIERPSSDYSPTSRSGFVSPRVTFGNGRSPSGPDPDRESPTGGSAPEPALAPPPPPPPPAPPESPPSWVDAFSVPPIVTKQLVVSPAADVTDPLWGIAGLLLIPAAGAALGYRQARASQAVDRLLRRS